MKDTTHKTATDPAMTADLHHFAYRFIKHDNSKDEGLILLHEVVIDQNGIVVGYDYEGTLLMADTEADIPTLIDLVRNASAQPVLIKSVIDAKIAEMYTNHYTNHYTNTNGDSHHEPSNYN